MFEAVPAVLFSTVFFGLLATVTHAGCQDADAASAAAAQPSAPPPAAAPRMNGAVPAGLERFSGTVIDRRDAGHYAYYQLAPATHAEATGGPVWVATMTGPDGAPAAVGAAVSVNAYSAVTDFHSRRLDCRFSLLLFGRVSP